MGLLRRIRAGLPYLVVLAAGAVLYHAAGNFDFEAAPGTIGPDIWPKLILALMLLAAGWGFVSSVFAAARPAPDRPDEMAELEALLRPPELHPWLVWLAVGATFGYLLLLPVMGFFLATIVYTLVLLHLGQYRRAFAGAALSLALATAFMILFMRVVYVSLPTGIAPFDRVSFTVMAALGVR